MPKPSLALWPVLLIAAAPLWAQPDTPAQKIDPRIDAQTGRDTAQWPPDRLFKHLHERIEITIADVETPRLTGAISLDCTPVAGTRSSLVLDAGSTITVSSVKVNGAPATFTHENARLTITLPVAAAPGEKVNVAVEYTAKDPFKSGNGLNWIKGSKTDDGAERLAPQIYSQGESQWNHLWFPCHDYPNQKLTTELIAHVPEGFEVLSNGHLVSKGEPEGPQRLVRWHWLQDKPHPTYLVTMVIGRFDIVDVGGEGTARPGLSMPVYGRPGTADILREAFANTPAMVKFLEEYFDQPYPWDKYAQVMVRDFRWGGMENTSATTLADFQGRRGKGEMDDLIVHELGHQWTGDLVTCKSWDHLWLNEGWATFIEWLWIENQSGHDAYLDTVQRTMNSLGMSSRGSAPYSEAMVSKYYKDADAPFEIADNPYPKGGLVLHMLRERLGDQAFQKGVRLYMNRFKFGCAETDDFRRVLEEVSGQSLERFFEQWCTRPGLPRLAVDLAWSGSDHKLTIGVEQLQTINADNPAYGLRIPMYAEFENGEGEWLSVDTDRRSTSTTVSLPSKPRSVQVDPHMKNAAPSTIRKKLS